MVKITAVIVAAGQIFILLIRWTERLFRCRGGNSEFHFDGDFNIIFHRVVVYLIEQIFLFTPPSICLYADEVNASAA